MKLILFDPKTSLCDEWRKYFKDLPDVEILHTTLHELKEYDCLVSPANSFGLMDGGFDAVIINYFGVELMRKVQSRILEDYLGEQPVGTSIIVETGDEKHPYLAHTPTMRVPMSISKTDNIYLAMWGMLLAIRQFNRTASRKIESIACTGLGTGTGRVPAQQAARQMALAYQHFLNPPKYITWNFASERQLNIRYGGDDGCDFPPEMG